MEAIQRARYKLRQAELALCYLREVPNEIALDLRRAIQVSGPDLRLDTFFFSCLGLAQSAFYIIDDHHCHKEAIKSWRLKILDESGRRQFNRMMSLRDNDVHQGLSEAKTLEAMIPIKRSNDAWMYQQHQNFAILGVSRPTTDHENPDGRMVSSYDGLQGSMNLYVEVGGKTLDAADACALFIAQLTQMIDAVDKPEQLSPVQIS